MTTAQETFQKTVLDQLKVNMGTHSLSYLEYLKLPASQRSNDEADVVDSRFTAKMLEWLGYSGSDIIYNRPTPGSPHNKPDFVVKIQGATAFVVEDKSTDEYFNESSVKQLRRYTVGTAGYCIWTNARTILGLRFDANGHYQTLVDVRVDLAFGEQAQTTIAQDANFEFFYLIFQKQRFTTIATLISELAIDEQKWAQQATPLTDEKSLRTFIQESRYVLDQLTTAIRARLSTVTIELEEAVQARASSQQKYIAITTDLLNRLRGGGGVNASQLNKLEKSLRDLEAVLADIDITYIERLQPTMGVSTLPIWSKYLQDINAIISTQREHDLARTESRRIRSAYLLWLERYKIIESEEGSTTQETEQRRQQAFAEQVSYVFFVRLLLTRVLEDKGIMPHLVSDGGFQAWYRFIQGYGIDAIDEIGGESFLPLVYRRVAGFYRHFFQQPVFDWFLPDDYLLGMVLHRLSKYSFKDVTSDLLGFTYEAFIDRIARNKKGHFLTPPAIVEFMLDRAGYQGASIIGENLLDTACGSGSFLVHASRRLKQALQSTLHDPLEIARQFVAQVQTKLVGLEVNPFSCYLAELNLFIQVLDDLALLWRANEHPNIERFSVYNTNSLEMPQAVLYSERNGATTTFIDEAAVLDEAAPIKAQQGQFTYIVCNPPYINRGIILETKSYGKFPFYREVVKGDENFYLLFLRLAAYYASPGGTICFICPLNLLGDESTMAAREMFSKDEWSLQSITRFYARNVLFPGVLQGITIVRIDNLPGKQMDYLEVRGGHSLQEASDIAIQVQRSQVVVNYPLKNTWSKPWLVNADPRAYDLWNFVREHTEQELGDILQNKMDAKKGDARSTWTKPMLVTYPASQHVPLTKGKNIVDWGGWSASGYLNPFITIPSSSKDYKASLWVQRQIQRIVDVQQPETAIFLKEISGLEMKRPIRGTIIQRTGSNPVVADETVLVMYTLSPTYEQLAYALFGLLTSSIYNFLFSLFSTNAHVNFKEILRLPVPIWSEERERQLAFSTKGTLEAYQHFHLHEQRFGSDRAQHVLANAVLSAGKLPTLRLEELILRGDITLTGPPTYALDILLQRGQIHFAATLSSEATRAFSELLRSAAMISYTKGGKDMLLPNPRVASAFLNQVEQAQTERIRLLETISTAQQSLDLLALDAYAITRADWRDMVLRGVPWANE